MSRPDCPSSVHSSASDLDGPGDAFRAWARDPAEPEAVDLGPHGDVPMVELSRRLGGSPATLPVSASLPIGLPPGATIASAVSELLDARVDPDGRRCRPFRSDELRGLARLDADLPPSPRGLVPSTHDSRGHPDVR